MSAITQTNITARLIPAASSTPERNSLAKRVAGVALIIFGALLLGGSIALLHYAGAHMSVYAQTGILTGAIIGGATGGIIGYGWLVDAPRKPDAPATETTHGPLKERRGTPQNSAGGGDVVPGCLECLFQILLGVN